MKLEKYEALIGCEESTVEYRGAYAGADFYFNQWEACWGIRQKDHVLTILGTIDVDEDIIENVIAFLKAKKGMKDTVNKLEW